MPFQSKVFSVLALRRQASYFNQSFPQWGPGSRVSFSSSSQALLQTHGIRNSGGGTQQSGFYEAFPAILIHAQVWETQLSETPFSHLEDGFPKTNLEKPGRKTDKGKDTGSLMTFHLTVIFFFFLNQGSKLRGIRTSNWCAVATGRAWNVLICQQWAGYQNRPLAARQALKPWPLKSQVGKMPQESCFIPI